MNATAINGAKITSGLQRVALQSLADTCTIQRRTQASDGQGGFTDNWVDQYTGIACRLETFTAMRAGAEQVIAQKLTSLEPRIVVLPAGQDVLVEDRIVITSKANVSVEVKALLSPKSFELFREAICEIVQ